MHAAELRQPAEGRGGAPGGASSSSSEESACRSEAAAGQEGRPRRRLPALSSTLDVFMARRRQTVAGATPCFKSEPPGKLDRRVPSTPGSGLRATPARLRASCASPARAGRLWAPGCSQGRDRATGRLTAASIEPPPESPPSERPLTAGSERRRLTPTLNLSLLCLLWPVGAGASSEPDEQLAACAACAAGAEATSPGRTLASLGPAAHAAAAMHAFAGDPNPHPTRTRTRTLTRTLTPHPHPHPHPHPRPHPKPIPNPNPDPIRNPSRKAALARLRHCCFRAHRRRRRARPPDVHLWWRACRPLWWRACRRRCRAVCCGGARKDALRWHIRGRS